MEQAKAIINLKEGVIQLEGPVEFVRQYLDLYRPAVSGLAGAPRGTTRTSKKEISAKPAPLGRRRRGRAKRASCADAIRTEIQSGFFAEPMSTEQVKQRLVEKGMTCTDNSIRMNLRRLSESGLLSPLKEGRTVRYCRGG